MATSKKKMNYKYTSIPQTPSLKEAQILLPLPIITLIPTGCSAFFSTDPAHFLMLPRHWNDQLPSLACWQKKKMLAIMSKEIKPISTRAKTLVGRTQ